MVRASVADSPEPMRTVRLVFADGPFFPVRFWWFCWLLRTVRGSWPDCPQHLADCPRHLAGLSAWSVRTVRPSWPDGPPVSDSFAPWFDSSLPSFVLPRVLQGIVTKTWGWSITLLSWRLVCDSIHCSCVTGICLGYRPGSLKRIFTGSYPLPPL
jgi:hypothetical protein